MRSPTRRDYLALSSIAFVSLAAGCSSGDDTTAGDDSRGDEDADDGTDRADPGDDPSDDDDETGSANGDSLSLSTTPIVDDAPQLRRFEATDIPADAHLEWRVDGDTVATAVPEIVYEFDEPTASEVSVVATGDEHERVTTTVTGTDDSPLPTVGEPYPALPIAEELVLESRSLIGSPAAVLGVAYEQEPLIRRGYGWRDIERTEPVDLKSLFRIASLTKPMTRAATVQFLEETEYTMETRPLEVLDTDPRGDDLADERVYDITVAHCLDHELGWDWDESPNLPFRPRVVALELGLERPPTTEEIVGYWLTHDLDYEPGTDESYVNIGYSIVELLIEQETGLGFLAYLRDRVLDPVGIDDVYQARTFPADRPAREVAYDDDRQEPTIANLDERELVPRSDGGELYMESITGAAGLVATVDAYLKFLGHYEIPTGKRRDGPVADQASQTGGIRNGTAALAVQLPSGLDIVAIFNKRNPAINEQAQVEVVESALADLELDHLDA